MNKLKCLIYVVGFSLSLASYAANFEVFKSPTCGCCQKWVDALEADGHEVVIHHVDDLHKIKFDAGLPSQLGACHTAFVDGYVIEGHVPLEAIDELLESQPEEIKGIAVPGMPGESLGMEQGREPQPYIVYGFDQNQSIKPLSTYKGTIKLD